MLDLGTLSSSRHAVLDCNEKRPVPLNASNLLTTCCVQFFIFASIHFHLIHHIQ